MSTNEALPPGVALIAATAQHEPVIANLMQLYAHDFSEFIDIHPGHDGRFAHHGLSSYFTEPGHSAFLLTVDDFPAGFVLIAKGSRITGDPEVWDVAEFFVCRRHRKRGLGTAVAHEVWRRFPGRWEVRVRHENRPAQHFWRAAVRSFTPRVSESQHEEWVVHALEC